MSAAVLPGSQQHALTHADVEIVRIDRRNHHIFQPLLYQVASAVLSPAEIAAPIRQQEVKQQNLIVLLAEVIGVDVASKPSVPTIKPATIHPIVPRTRTPGNSRPGSSI